ncbi:MAG: isoleucine--tRNA ligase [Candidatus Acidiferrales bacterium]
MKAKLPEREPLQLAEWEAMGLYSRILESRAGAPICVLHDGPPYPTGDIHLGTGLGKILKDMVVKSKTMAGFRSPFIPGWDCHGLPIETKVEKELGGKKDSVTPAEFRRLCREFAMRYVESNRQDFKRLGIFGRWDEPYLTMNFSYEAAVADAFLTFLEKGYVYRGRKPVYWCIFDRTALAEAEVEYADHTSPSIWVRYQLVQEGAAAEKIPSGLKSKLKGKNVYAIIWTTTPWTIPASMALAFRKDFEYVLANTSVGDVYIVAEALLERVEQEVGLHLSRCGGPFPGSVFANAKFQHPFLDRTVPGVLGAHVTLEQGTGIVHTAPGHGAEDFYTGQEYGLDTYAPIDDDGRFTEGLPSYKGKTVFEANPFIIGLLKERGALLAEHKISHSYPHCWRCHNPVIFRATEQWFIHLDKGSATIPAPLGHPLRSRALEEVQKVKWKPAWGEERLREMVTTRPDWCISRQRFWGVPLIIFYCEACGKRLEDFDALRNVVRWFERAGADAWFAHSAEELLPAGTKCSCGKARWRKEKDILDVWFDSGSSHLAVLSEGDGTWPAEVYLEGPDQFRGWFQSSLLIAVGARGRAPYRQVVTHGWTLDAKGEPMSKSLGNFVSPRDVSEEYGADMVRLWVASQDYFTNTHYSDEVMAQLGESYRKIRNTFRFAISNLYDFDPARDAMLDAELEEMDAWMLQRTGKLVKDCRRWYEEFEFGRVFHALHDFCAAELSAFYFDVLKDRLYTFAARSRGRRSAQTAVYRIAAALVRLVAPILVFTAEEVWKSLPKAAGTPESVHLAYFPAAETLETGLRDGTVKDWESLLLLRGNVLSALEDARKYKLISSALEAKVLLVADGADAALLEKYRNALAAFFIVSQVELRRGTPPASPDAGAIGVMVTRAEGKKCERCWNYSVHVGESAAYPGICERCLAALREIEGNEGATGSVVTV